MAAKSAESSSDLITDVQSEGDHVTIALKGSIDPDRTPELRDELLKFVRENRPKKLIVNMAEVVYVGSAGLAVFVEAVKALKQQGEGNLYMTNLQPKVKGLLEIIHLDQLFNPCEDEDEAKAK